MARHALIIITIATIILTASSAGADTIALRSAARLPAGAQAITLAAVADLEGAYAEGLANVVIAELAGPPRVLEFSVAEIRSQLEAAGVHWGRVNLQGSKVVVRPASTNVTSAPSAMQPASLQSAAAKLPGQDAGPAYRLVSEFAEESTVRGAIGRYIAAGLHTNIDDVQLAFDDRDEALLATMASQFRIEVEAVSSLHSDRIQMVVRLWDGMRIAQNASLTVLPLVRSTAVLAGRDLEQGAKLVASDLAIESVWVSPSKSGWLTTIDEVAGQVLERSVHAGEQLVPKHLRKHIIIRRGDRAIVRCLVGGIVISLEAECRQEGADGETIEFRKLGERDTFFATVTGPGEAVIEVGKQ